MKPRRAPGSILLAALAGACPRAALAAEQPCPALAVESDVSFRSRFPDLLESIRTDLAARPDLDTCARVVLRFEGDSEIRVAVTLRDGRATSRTVARSDDVVPTLQALLLVPEPVQRERATAPAQKQSPAPLPDAARTVPPDRNAPSTPVDGAARDLGFELSLLAGARIGDGQFGAGGGMLSLLEVKRWLFGFQGRIDGCRAVAGGELEAALELGLFAGRRIDVGSFALDLSAGPAVAMKGLASSEKVSVPADGARAAPPPARTTGPVPRLFVGARLGFSPRSVFRWFVGLDGELGPARVGAPTDAASSRLPRFAVGLALGATVGTR